jgi:putative Holliday junction resolvase
MARLLGIDFGLKRVGVALTDEEGKIAFPKAVLPNDKTLTDELVRLITTNSVTEVVLGESLDNRGVENKVARSAKALGRELAEDTGVTVHFEPEFYSSQEVRTHTGEYRVDAEAAAVILNSFLTKRHGNNY